MRIRSDKIDRFIRVLDGEIKHLILFDYELFDNIGNKINYLISEKGGIANSVNHNSGEIRIDSYNFLPPEKILTFHNVIKLIKSVANKNKYEKGLYKDKFNIFNIFTIFSNKCLYTINIIFR